MGIIGLLQSTLSIISTTFGIGLGSAAVRDVALAVSKGEKSRVSHTIIALRRLVWFTGLGGGLFCVLAAPWLSQATFSNPDYTLAFQILGSVVVLNQLYAGQMALLQGYRRLKEMALISVLGGFASLFIAVPLYFLYGKKGIVPALLILAIVPVILARLFVRRIPFKRITQTWSTTWDYGKPMIQLGAATMLSGLVFMLSIWLVRLEVQEVFGVEGVGQFQAGWGVTTIYLQLVFQAMSRDYYPRLSALSDQPEGMITLVNEQIHLSLLIATPLIIAAIILAPFIVQILYSSAFKAAVPQMQWLAMGTLLKVLSWPLGYIILALKRPVIFFITESIGALGFWVLSMYAVGQWGLDGIGVAYSINYLIYLSVVFTAGYFLIRFQYDWNSMIWIGISISIAGISFVLVYIDPTPIRFWIAILLLIVLSMYYGYQLNRLTALFSNIWSRLK